MYRCSYSCNLVKSSQHLIFSFLISLSTANFLFQYFLNIKFQSSHTLSVFFLFQSVSLPHWALLFYSFIPPGCFLLYVACVIPHMRAASVTSVTLKSIHSPTIQLFSVLIVITVHTFTWNNLNICNGLTCLLVCYCGSL